MRVAEECGVSQALLESEIQALIRAELGNPKRYPGLALWPNVCGVFRDEHSGTLRRVGVGNPGGADLIGIYHGRFIGIEVKTPTGRQSDEQKAFEAGVTRLGGAYCLARSVDDAVQFIRKLDEERQAA